MVMVKKKMTEDARRMEEKLEMKRMKCKKCIEEKLVKMKMNENGKWKGMNNW